MKKKDLEKSILASISNDPETDAIIRINKSGRFEAFYKGGYIGYINDFAIDTNTDRGNYSLGICFDAINDAGFLQSNVMFSSWENAKKHSDKIRDLPDYTDDDMFKFYVLGIRPDDSKLINENKSNKKKG